MSTASTTRPILTSAAHTTRRMVGQRVVITANPFSGAGPNRRIVEDLADALRERGLIAEVIWDRDERIARLADPDFIAGCRCIVAAGGDGTVADVINQRIALPLAMLPIGNENLFAREFRYTRGSDILADAIAVGSVRTIDLAEIAAADDTPPRLFSLMLTAGIDADIVHRVDAWRQQGQTVKRINHLSYLGPAFEALRKYDYPPLRITTDDGQVAEGTFALVFNIPQYALGLPFTPEATPSDGLLDYVMFKKAGPVRLVEYALSLVKHRHLHRDDVLHGQARALTLTSDRPAPVQADGDPAGTTPVDLTIRPATLQIVHVPQHYGKG